jgi:hypothetical protein
MANLGEFLNATFLNAGLDIENESLKQIVTSAASTNIDDSLVEKFNQSYLTINSAKNNPDLRKHFYALSLNGLDTELDGVMAELGLDESVVSNIKAEKSSFKRASLLAKTVKDLEGQKANTGSASAKAEIQAKIDALNSEVVRLREEKANAVKEVENTYKSQINDILLNNHFANYNYSAPVSKEVNVKIARQLIAEEMAKRGYQLNPENGEFKLSSSEGLEVFENNQKVGFKEFSERLLAQHKLLAVNTPQEPNNPNAPGQPVNIQTQGSQGNRNGKLLNKYDQLIEEANNDLK